MNDYVENLAASLPHLKTLHLGPPCWFNSCDTTVASLMSISTHCLVPTVLQAHFNTQTIVSDMQRLIGGGVGDNKAKCKLRRLTVGYLPPKVHVNDMESIAMGFKVVFSCLTGFEDGNGCWLPLLGVDGRRTVDTNASTSFLRFFHFALLYAADSLLCMLRVEFFLPACYTASIVR